MLVTVVEDLFRIRRKNEQSEKFFHMSTSRRQLIWPGVHSNFIAKRNRRLMMLALQGIAVAPLHAI